MQTDFEIFSEHLSYCPETGNLSWIKKAKKRDLSRPAGYVDSKGYVIIQLNEKKYLAHRVAWLLTYGTWPKDQLDHENHVRNDNRLINLRDIDYVGNQRNASLRKDNKSGITGVRFAKNKWNAEIRVHQKHINLGRFEVLEDAVLARKEAEKKYGFHENHGIPALEKESP